MTPQQPPQPTPDEIRRVAIWQQAFSDPVNTWSLLYDLGRVADSFPESQQAGANRLILYMAARTGRLKQQELDRKGRNK